MKTAFRYFQPFGRGLVMSLWHTDRSNCDGNSGVRRALKNCTLRICIECSCINWRHTGRQCLRLYAHLPPDSTCSYSINHSWDRSIIKKLRQCLELYLYATTVKFQRFGKPFPKNILQWLFVDRWTFRCSDNTQTTINELCLSWWHTI